MSGAGDLLQRGSESGPARKSASHGEAGYARRERDAYFTEPWVTQQLLAAVDFRLTPAMSRTQTLVWEPACGDGRMAAQFVRANYPVLCSDIHDYGFRHVPIDFLRDPPPAELRQQIAAIVTNPPFDLAVHFIRRALELTEPQRGKVAILQRHEFDAPASHHPLFRPPFAAKLILPRRPRWSDGPDKASPRFPYAWYLWDWRHQGEPVLRWLPDPDIPPTEALL